MTENRCSYCGMFFPLHMWNCPSPEVTPTIKMTETNFLNNITLPENNGGKHHRCHKELAKVISDLQARVKKIEFFERIIKMGIEKSVWCKLEKALQKVIDQEEKIKEEERKLERLKFEASTNFFIPIIDF